MWRTRNSPTPKKMSWNHLFNLVTFLVKSMLSRNFCKRYVRVSFLSYHTVCHSVEIMTERRSQFLRKNWHFSRQINVFTKELISRNFCKRYVRVNFLSYHTVCHSVEITTKRRSQFLRKNRHFFRQINVFTKELISRIFFSVIAFYSTFPHCAC